MNGKKKLIGYISFFYAIAITIFILLQYVLIDSLNKTPYELSDNYYQIAVRYKFGTDSLDKELLVNAMIEMCTENQDMIIIKIDDNMKELALLDLQKHLDNGDFTSGLYFDREDFYSDQKIVLLENNSPLHYLIDDNKVLYKDIVVKGIYNSTHKSASKYNQYHLITTIGHAESMTGTYYFDNISKSEMDKIRSLFRRNNYEYNDIKDDISQSNYFDALTGTSEYTPMILVVIFIHFSILLSFSQILMGCKRYFYIHWISGARKITLFKNIVSVFYPQIVMGVFLGNCIALLLMIHLLVIPLYIMLVSIIIQLVLIFCVLTLSFITNNTEFFKEGVDR